MMRLQSARTVEVRGKVIGGVWPMICLPLVAQDKAALLSQAEELKPLAPDMLEWRIDGYANIKDMHDCMRALAQLRATIGATPLIFTCRIDQEGGMQKLSRQTRLELIKASIRTGLLDIVDIELCNDANFIETIRDEAERRGVKLILSFHDFEQTPAEEAIVGRLVSAQEMGAHIAKAAVMPQNHQDVLVLLSATLKARTQALQIPIVAMSMGAEGVVTRLAGGLFGSDITFAIGKSASAPGQIPIGALRQAMAVLYP